MIERKGTSSAVLFTVRHVVQSRDDDQRQYRGHKDAEDQRDGQTIENRVVHNEKRADHGRKAREHDGLGARDGRLHNGPLEVQAAVHLQVDEVHQQD